MNSGVGFRNGFEIRDFNSWLIRVLFWDMRNEFWVMEGTGEWWGDVRWG